jgi:hypothetical protein
MCCPLYAVLRFLIAAASHHTCAAAVHHACIILANHLVLSTSPALLHSTSHLQTALASLPHLRCCGAPCLHHIHNTLGQINCVFGAAFYLSLADRPGKPTTPALLQLSAPHLPLLLKAGLSRRAHATHASFSSRGDKLVASYHGDHAYVFDVTGEGFIWLLQP